MIVFFTSCGGKNSDNKKAAANDSITIPANVNMVVGIGKVEPENGIVELASNTGGIVTSVKTQAGDSIKKGQVIVTLDSKDDALQAQQIRDQITTQHKQVRADQVAVGQYQAQLEDKTNTLTTSEKLAQTGAETKQNVESLKTDQKVLQVQLEKSQKTAAVSQSKINELEAQLKSAQHNLNEKIIKAPSDGVVLSLDAKVGSAIQPLASFAQFASTGPMVIHGEADEMFANKLALGQKVSIHYIGDSLVVATGKITFLSPTLNNKSLFTDEPGEQQDRRVRRFKVLLNNTDGLLINQKVECNIYLKNNAQ